MKNDSSPFFFLSIYPFMCVCVFTFFSFVWEPLFSFVFGNQSIISAAGYLFSSALPFFFFLNRGNLENIKDLPGGNNVRVEELKGRIEGVYVQARKGRGEQKKRRSIFHSRKQRKRKKEII